MNLLVLVTAVLLAACGALAVEEVMVTDDQLLHGSEE